MSISDYFQAPRGLSITKVGWIFIALTLGVGVAAMNSGNNLLFLLLGAMLSLIVGSGLLSEAMLRYVDVKRQLPSVVDAKTDVRVRLSVENGIWWPLFSLGIRDMGFRKDDGAQQDAETRLGSGYVGVVPSRGSERGILEYYFPERGRYESTELVVETRFPFEFFEKTRSFQHSLSVLAAPPAAGTEKTYLKAGRSGTSKTLSNKGSVGEFYGLRDYRPGDSLKHIYWKGLAKTRDLVIKERVSQTEEAVSLLFLNWLSPERRVDDKELPHEGFEAALRFVRDIVERADAKGRLEFSTLEERFVLSHHSEAGLYQALEVLATVKPMRCPRSELSLPDSEFDVVIGDADVILSVESPNRLSFEQVRRDVEAADEA